VPLAALPFVNWIFWASLSAGSLLVVGLTELLGGTTRGYRLFMAALLAVFAGILLLSELALPSAAAGVPAGATEELRRLLVFAFAVGCLAYLVASIARLPRSGIAIGTGLIGLAALVTLAAAGGVQATPLFAAQLVLTGLTLGAVTAAMLLGHWYLVTPRLSPQPLRRMMWLLLVALLVQAATFAIAMLTFDAADFPGALAWLAWMRLGVGIVLPVVITALAIAASGAPSLQASTGLLYIGLALIIAGSIGGASISYLSGVPV
jgi:hypothetical protein